MLKYLYTLVFQEFFSKVGKLKPLFGESSLEESDSEEKLNERFRYKNEFEGKSGKKVSKS